MADSVFPDDGGSVDRDGASVSNSPGNVTAGSEPIAVRSFVVAEDRHPIEERPELSPERRLQLLEQRLAQLWDQVWWLSLPPERRAAYEAEGFRDPVTRFYGDGA